MITRRLVEHSKDVARLAPVRPAVKAGIRASLAAILPAVLSNILQLTGGLWLSVGGFNTSFVDKGGSYRARASTMGAAALAGALSATVAGLASMHPAVAIPAALLWVTACSYAGAYGTAASFVGNTAASTFVISLALPGTGLVESLERGAFVIGGALWAMTLSLVLWPIRPYRPSRLAVARCFRAVADLAADVGHLSTHAQGDASWQALIQRHHGRLRETLEEARNTLAATRRGRSESHRGERLLVLLEIADAMFGVLVGLGDVMESLVNEGGSEPARAEVERTLSAASQTLQELAPITETEGAPQQLPSLNWGAEALRKLLDPAGADSASPALPASAQVKTLHAAQLLAQLREFAGLAVGNATSLHDDHPTHGEQVPQRGEHSEQRPSLLEPLRVNLTWKSMVLRHALRVGVTTTLAVAVAKGLNLSHGYWVTITVLTIMLPYSGPTFLKALQRVVGTVVGGILAAAVAAELHHPYAILVLVFFTAAISVAVIVVNYGLFTIFVTVTFVLLAEIGSGDWNLARVRIINTLMGGALALAGSWLLWERPEKELFPEQLAEAHRAQREYLRQLVAAYLDGRKFLDPALSEARRKMGLATINAETSFQRLLAEPRRRAEPIEPPMTLLVYTRRFAAAMIALFTTQPQQATVQLRSLLERFAQNAEKVLDDLADAALQGRNPAPLPDFEAVLQPSHAPTVESATRPGDDSLLQAQLRWMVRQLTVLHGAASRRSAPPETGHAPSA
ncbi:FUSC family protein [Hyalangium versicolor]|uniref:FUSC family protein n=1 Tax=Hyalangium versicolor TaxID=2861190 RepID=UPI001CCC1169|nr:FUSC family protein [Hyalangium versicolor]